MFMKSFQTIEALANKEIELDTKAQSKSAELAEAERAAGEAYLDDNGVASVDGVLRLRAETEAIGRAIATVRSQRSEVIGAALRSQAQEARAAAAKKTSDLEALTKKTARLLDQLAEAEGVEGGQFVPSAGQLKSARLSSEIGELERRAANLDAAPLPDSGVFDNEGADVVTNESVVLAVLTQQSAGPSCAEVRAWLAAVESEATARNKAENIEHLPRRVRVEWKGGAITESASYIFYPSLAAVLPSSLSSSLGFGEGGCDVASGTFRALGR